MFWLRNKKIIFWCAPEYQLDDLVYFNILVCDLLFYSKVLQAVMRVTKKTFLTDLKRNWSGWTHSISGYPNIMYVSFQDIFIFILTHHISLIKCPFWGHRRMVHTQI